MCLCVCARAHVCMCTCILICVCTCDVGKQSKKSRFNSGRDAGLGRQPGWPSKHVEVPGRSPGWMAKKQKMTRELRLLTSRLPDRPIMQFRISDRLPGRLPIVCQLFRFYVGVYFQVRFGFQFVTLLFISSFLIGLGFYLNLFKAIVPLYFSIQVLINKIEFFSLIACRFGLSIFCWPKGLPL